MKTVLPSQLVPTGIADCDIKFLSRHATKVLIQETTTRRYLARTGLWTIRPKEAMAFQAGSAAMEHLTLKKLKNVRLVFTRDIKVREIFPLTKRSAGGS